MRQVVGTILVLVATVGVAPASPMPRVAAQSNEGQPAGVGKPGTLRACSLLTKAEIKSLLGERAPGFFDQIPTREESLGNGGSECFHSGITIQLDAYPVAAFDEPRKRYTAGGRTQFQPVSDVGDAAYFYEQDPGKESHIVGIFAKVGQHVLTLSMDVNAPNSAESIRPAVLALSKAAVAKLR